MSTIFCTQCGKQASSPESKFCAGCGSALEAQSGAVWSDNPSPSASFAWDRHPSVTDLNLVPRRVDIVPIEKLAWSSHKVAVRGGTQKVRGILAIRERVFRCDRSGRRWLFTPRLLESHNSCSPSCVILLALVLALMGIVIGFMLIALGASMNRSIWYLCIVGAVLSLFCGLGALAALLSLLILTRKAKAERTELFQTGLVDGVGPDTFEPGSALIDADAQTVTVFCVDHAGSKVVIPYAEIGDVPFEMTNSRGDIVIVHKGGNVTTLAVGIWMGESTQHMIRDFRSLLMQARFVSL